MPPRAASITVFLRTSLAMRVALEVMAELENERAEQRRKREHDTRAADGGRARKSPRRSL
jgi:hypothetical protein